MCWLYSMSNMLVIQQLDTLYLGENYVSVVCERVKNSSVYAFKSFLATGSREWLATCDSPKCYMCETGRKLKGHDSWSTTGQKRIV